MATGYAAGMPSTRSIGLLALVCLALVAACSGTGQTAPVPAGPNATLTSPSTDPPTGLPVVQLADLPPEAAETMALIDAGGPFPYPQDGSSFENRESILPRRPKGYYHEYTVPTPGTSDRGARRFVTGSGGEVYYTDDHYQSFRTVRR